MKIDEQRLDDQCLKQLAKEYAENGVVKIPALCPDYVTQGLSEALARYLEDDPGEGNSTYFGHGPGRTTARWIYQKEKAIPDLLKDSGVAEAVAKVIGAAKLFLWYDIAFIHDADAKSEGASWHHDMPAFPFKGEHNPSLWIALTEVTMDSSPLQCIKGSHRTDKFYLPKEVYYDENANFPEKYVATPDFDELVESGDCEILSWTMHPGDILIIHPLTVHGAPGNKTKSNQRIAYTVRLMGDECEWQPDALSMGIPNVDTSQMQEGDRPERLPLPVVHE